MPRKLKGEFRICPVCSNEYYVKRDKVNAGKGKYCSKVCYDKERSLIHKGIPKPKSSENLRKYNEKRKAGIVKHPEPWNKKPTATIKCETCGKEFEVENRRKGEARFCSRECLHVWMKTITGEEHWHYRLVNRVCMNCGKEFKCKPAKIKYGEGKFCSRNCQGAYFVAHAKTEQTAIEKVVASVLDELGVTYETQKVFGHFVCDFYIPSVNLVIEADGDYWHNKPEVKKRDRMKNYFLMVKVGLKLLRLWEHEIKQNPGEIIRKTIYSA